MRCKGFFLFVLTILAAVRAFTQPTISAVTPSNGPVGSTVTISGTNFSTTLSNNIVYFGAVRANITGSTTNAITATVPAGATFQPVTVTVGSLTAASPKPFIVTFAGAAPRFTERSFVYTAYVDSTESGIETTNYSIGDLDNDGKIDVAVVDRLNNSLTVYKNTTTGGAVSFAAGLVFAAGSSPRNLAIADIDGDGKLDVAVSNISANTVSIYKNTSSGTAISFASRADFATALQPSGIAVTDIDKDGRPDLVINCISFPGAVSVLRNTSTAGAVSFAAKSDLAVPGTSIEEIRTADLDGDGLQDILVPNFGLGAISIYRNTSSAGTIAFAPVIHITSNGYPEQVEIADLNNDGKPDMAVSYYLTSNLVTVFTNSSTAGNIAFNTSSDYAAVNLTGGIEINDLDGDSKPDLAACTGLDSLSLFKNTSNAGGAISFDTRVNIACPWYNPMLSGDFDGDGKTDLAFRSGLYRVTIWKNRVTQPQITQVTPDKGGLGTAITISGFNLGNVNAVTIGGIPAQSFTVVNATTIIAYPAADATGTITVSAANGKDAYGHFEFFKKPVLTAFTPTSAGINKTIILTGQNFTGTTAVLFGGVPAASFTVDSPTGITAIVGLGASGFVTVITPGGKDSLNGFTFIPAPTITSFTPATGTAGTAVTITGTNFSNVQSVSFGNAPVASFSVNSTTSITAIIGAGGTGNLEIITTGGTVSKAGFTYTFQPVPVITNFTPAIGAIGSSITITGNNFNPVAANNIVFVGHARALVTAASATSLTITIPNGATYHPITVTNNATSLSGASALPFVVSFPTGALNFKLHEDFQAGNQFTAMQTVASADFDGDGKLDIITANDQESTVSILRNSTVNDLLSFSKLDLAVPTNPRDMAIGDIDGDGKPDIVIKNTQWMAVLRNTSSPGAVSLVPGSLYEVIGNAGLSIVDIDRDGRSDIICGDPFFNRILVFRNNGTKGNISFYARELYPLGGSPLNITVADIDGDGWKDVISSNANNTVSVTRNTSQQGQVSFAAAVQLSAGNSASSICSGDLDGDGKADLAVADAGDNTTSVYRNTSTIGNVSFADRISYDEGFVVASNQQKILMADLDGDGKPDLCTSHFIDPGPALVYKNNSRAGTLKFDRLNNTAFLAGGQVNGIAIGDLNLDGKPDLVQGLYFDNLVAVLKNDFLPLPEITSFTPAQGKKGTIVTITGKNFIRVDSVRFGGVLSTNVNANSENELTAMVGGGASGVVEISSPAATISLGGFTYIPTPEIVSFSPASAAPGDTITIIGRDFIGVKSVTFIDTESPYFNMVSADTLKVVVPEGSGSAYIVVRTETEQGSAIGFNFINSPVISSFTPVTATKGETVTITGKNFSSATAVHFGGLPVTSFNIVSNNSITAVLGGGSSGYVRVTNTSGVDSLAGFTYKVVTAVDNPTIDLSAELSIRPNPANDFITVKHPASVQKATLLLVDANGRTVLIATTSKMSKQTTCRVHNLAAGLYQLIWIDGLRQAHKTLMIAR